MANSAYVNLWNKLDENFMTARKDPCAFRKRVSAAGYAPWRVLKKALTLHRFERSTPFETAKAMVKTIARKTGNSRKLLLICS